MAEQKGQGAQAASLDIADILRAYFADPQAGTRLSPEQRKAVRDITRCRTAALGGHQQRCLECGYTHPVYNSCRNRHCPKCQSIAQARWVQRQLQRILPVRCFHVVFTLPAQLRPIARFQPRALYELLFKTASRTLLDFGHDPRWLGGQLGITAVLHTWARDLTYHPHLHCIVTAGGLSADGHAFVHARERFLFPVAALAETFRGRFLDGLRRLRNGRVPVTGHLQERAFRDLVDTLYNMQWNVYVKAPFAGPSQVFRYLGHYTHRVGISNHRLLEVTDSHVTFRTRADRSVRVPSAVFVKRWLCHVLPPGFVKIRHYGLMASGHMVKQRNRARQLLSEHGTQPRDVPAPAQQLLTASWQHALCLLTGIDVRRCPRCRALAVVHEPLDTSVPLASTRARPPPKLATTA